MANKPSPPHFIQRVVRDGSRGDNNAKRSNGWESRQFWEEPPREPARDRAVVPRQARWSRDSPRLAPSSPNQDVDLRQYQHPKDLSDPIITPDVIRERQRECDRGRLADRFADQPIPRFETTYASSDTKDVTIHLEADVFVDIDDELEILNRLMRIGNFRGALAFFDEHLKDHRNNPLAFVQYAEVLLEMEDYKSLLALDASRVHFRENDGNDTIDKSDWQTLENEWMVLRAFAMSYAQEKKEPILQHAAAALRAILPGTESLSSTGVRILILCMNLPDGVVPVDRLENWAKWKKVYTQLLAQGRIWDFHDLFIAVMTGYGVASAFDAFFERRDRQALKQMVDSWSSTTRPDDATQLALLNILSIIIFSSDGSTPTPPLTECALELADAIGKDLIMHFPAHARSRPFLLSCLAKNEFLALRGDQRQSVLGRISGPLELNGPGMDRLAVVTDWGGRTLPYYIPVRDENPGLPRLEVSAQQKAALKMLLGSAEELQDYRLQKICLQEMILQSDDPWPVYDSLCQLQESTLDMSGYLTACLSKYLACRDERDKVQLFGELMRCGVVDHPSSLTLPRRFAARDMIQHALTINKSRDTGNNFRVAVKYEPYVGSELGGLIRKHCPDMFSVRLSPRHGYQDRLPVSEQDKPSRQVIIDIHQGDDTPGSSVSKHSDDDSVRRRIARSRSPPHRTTITIDQDRRRSFSPVRVRTVAEEPNTGISTRFVPARRRPTNERMDNAVANDRDVTITHRRSDEWSAPSDYSESVHVTKTTRRVFDPRTTQQAHDNIGRDISPRSADKFEQSDERFNYKYERRNDNGTAVRVNVDVMQNNATYSPQVANELGKVVGKAVEDLLFKHGGAYDQASREERGRSRERMSKNRPQSPESSRGSPASLKSVERVSSWLKNNNMEEDNRPIPPKDGVEIIDEAQVDAFDANTRTPREEGQAAKARRGSI
ncbi:hypothetical protein OQA88_833 [Cercophora sp. LCS_1]